MDVAIWKAAEGRVLDYVYHDGVPLEHLEPDHSSGITSTRVGWGARRPGLGNAGVDWELRRQRDAGSQGWGGCLRVSVLSVETGDWPEDRLEVQGDCAGIMVAWKPPLMLKDPQDQLWACVLELESPACGSWYEAW